ncbi:MAG: hypothetical protein GYA24_24030 [Candidatus Lokiarchaeota archaeon]|nr:hypothetical protein [Candidatus Lokiarchaeota archaeon]
MARLIDAVGVAVASPEAAWDTLAPHKAMRLASIAIGLAAFSRLVMIILDIHRLAIGSPLDDRTLWILIGTLDRGSIWHSLAIATCGIAMIVVACTITAAPIARAGRAKYARILADLITATTIRMPLIAGSTLIVLFLVGDVYVVESTASLCTWIAGFALAALETWRASGKVAARHGARPLAGFLTSLVTSVIMAAASIGLIYLMGGLD